MSKEWSGNSKSVRVMNGCSNNVDRAAGDYYTTDPAAVEEFLDALGWWKPNPEKQKMVVWEPACGCGNISEILKRRFSKVYSTDLFDRGYEKMDKQIDFLKAPLIDPNCEVIITNPPYSLCDEFILHALDILPMGGGSYDVA